MEKEQFNFRKGKGTRDAIGLIRTIGEIYKIKMCMQYLLTSKKHLSGLEKLMGILKKIYCGLEGDEALK